jgi:hypothetical protein
LGYVRSALASWSQKAFRLSGAPLCQVTSKAFLQLANKLNSRLTPELTCLYSKDYIGGGELTKGMDILEKLNKAQSDMALLKELVACVAPGPEDTARTAGQFRDVVAAVREAGMAIASSVDETVASLFLQHAIDEKHWDQLGQFIKMGSPESKLDMLSDVRGKEVIKDIIVKVIVDFCKGDKYDEGFGVTKDCLETAISSLTEQDFPGFHEDLRRVLLIFNASEDMTATVCKETDKAREQMQANRQSLFWKALTMLHNGKEAMRLAAAASDMIVKMTANSRKLETLLASLPRLPSSEQQGTLWQDTKGLVLKSAEAWVTVQTSLADIEANSSVKFLSEHAKHLQKVKEHQQTLAEMLADAAQKGSTHTTLRGNILK